MKTNRLQFKYRKSASALHRKVGDLLRSGETFVGYHEAYQEYPVNKVNLNYQNGSHHFDWVVPRLKVVIEVHGRQHFYPTAFDGDYEAAVAGFEELKYRDTTKEKAALDAGFVYIMVPYSAASLLDSYWLMIAYKLGQERLGKHNGDLVEHEQLFIQLAEEKRTRRKEAHKEYLASEHHQKELALAQESRRRYYLRLKELKKERDGA